MQYTKSEAQDTYDKVSSHLKGILKKPDPSNLGLGYIAITLDRLLDTLKSYSVEGDVTQLKDNMLKNFSISDIPEINKRQIVKQELSNIKGIESFKAFLDEIGF